MKKIIVYLKSFWIALLLIVIAVFFWCYIPAGYDNFRGGLLSSILGVGIAIFVAEGFKNMSNYRRIKKTFGLLKLITIPFLKNYSQNFIDTANEWKDICTIEKAANFMAMMSNLSEIEKALDKSWLQLIFSQDFLDAVKSDEHFNRISHAILELLLFINTSYLLSINAKTLMMNRVDQLDEVGTQLFITKAQEFRNTLIESSCSLQKYVNQLDQELALFFLENNIIYEEFER